jgi:hypothetical protein
MLDKGLGERKSYWNAPMVRKCNSSGIASAMRMLVHRRNNAEGSYKDLQSQNAENKIIHFYTSEVSRIVHLTLTQTGAICQGGQHGWSSDQNEPQKIEHQFLHDAATGGLLYQ